MASIQTQMISFYAIFLSILLTTILFSKVNSLDTTSFSIDKFNSNQPNLIFQAGAYASNKKLILTEDKLIRESIGRALYYAPIQIWDSKTGDVVSFQTNFTFVIDASYIPYIADGLAFFIAPVDTKPAKGDGYLGVFNSTDYDKTAQTVAVEFDTVSNEWDPKYTHIGIDVNRIKSDRTESWDFQNREEVNVVIDFNAANNELSVTITSHKTSSTSILQHVVPLKDIVPEWVSVGFSASTRAGYYRTTHEVLSWSFRSELTETSSSKGVADA